MKEYLFCKILGHKFIGYIGNGLTSSAISPTKFCIRCGLSKEEIKEMEKKQ